MFKGILKKTSAICKFTLAVLPYVLCIGIVPMLIGKFGGDAKEDKEIQKFMTSNAFIERRAEDLEQIETSFNDGKITQEQKTSYTNEINSQSYAEAIIKTPEFYPYRDAIDQIVWPYKVATLVGGVSALVGCISTQFYLKTPISEKLIKSGKEDWKFKKKKKEEKEDAIEIKY